MTPSDAIRLSAVYRFYAETDAQFCSYSSDIGNFGNSYDGVSIGTTLLLGPPALFVAPSNLTIPAGQSATLLVSAFVPGSTQGFPWTVTTNHATSWLTVPSGGPFSTGQAVQVSIAPNTPDGSVGTLSIDSSPPFAAPSVETGPIEVQVTVGTPKAQSEAGVLLMGGIATLNSIAATPEVFDATIKQLLPTQAPNFAPTGHTATLLNTGDILIAGGVTQLEPGTQPSPPIASAQLFHPAARTFTLTGSMNTARTGHTATLLPDGKVLVTGGADADGIAMVSAELYDPASGKFTPTGSTQTARAGHTASLVNQPGQSAKVIVYAGSTWELWDEASGKFSAQGNMAAAQSGFPQPVALPDGRLVIAGGGDNDRNIATEQLLTLDSQSFTLGHNLNVPRSAHTLTALSGTGDLLALGGSDIAALASAELRDSNGWTLLPGKLATARWGHTATLLPDGSVFVAGGENESGILTSSEFYLPKTQSFIAGPLMSPRGGQTATFFATSITSLAASPNPSTVGQSITLAATVTALTGTPAGSVQFFDSSTLLETVPLHDGQAAFTTSSLGAGSHSLVAVYSGTESPVPASRPPGRK